MPSGVYELFALFSLILQFLILAYIIGGFFIRSAKSPKQRSFHLWFTLTTVALQLIFSLRFPLLELARYCKALSGPQYATYIANPPFILDILQTQASFGTGQIALAIAIACMSPFVMANVMSYRELRTA